MLPSLGFQEIVVLAILALVVVGPKDLPLLLRKIGRWTARLRGMANEFRSGFDELARQAELDELRKEVDALRRHSNFTDLGREFSEPLDAPIAENNPPPPAIPHDAQHAALVAPQIAPASIEPQSETSEQVASAEAEPAPEGNVTPLRSVS